MANETNGESKGRKPGEPEIPFKLEDVVLYDGPLAELNAIDMRRQFDFAGVLNFNSEWYFLGKTHEEHNSNDFTEIKKELIGRGFIGLVNRKTAYIWSGVDGRLFYKVEGTPIVPEKVKDKKL